MTEAARDGQTQWAMREIKRKQLEWEVLRSRLYFGRLTVDALEEHGMTIERWVSDVNAQPDGQRMRSPMTVAKARDCMRDWQQYLKDGGDPLAIHL